MESETPRYVSSVGTASRPARLATAPVARPAELLHGVQYLRGIAALLVVLMHSNGMMRYGQYFGESPATLIQTGLFGVAVFFVISGFIITVVSLDASGTPRIARPDFARRRFVRIVPFMWICALGYNLLSFLGTGQVEWAEMARGLVLWPVGELKPNVLWSLRHELVFYALFAAAMLGAARRPAWLLAWFAAPLVVGILAPWIEPALREGPAALRDLVQVVLVGAETGANLQFGVGYGLGLLWLRRSSLVVPRLSIGPLGLTALAVAAVVLVEALQLPAGPLRHLSWTALAAAIAWAAIASRQEQPPLHGLGMWLGNASFSIYLVHNAVLLVSMEILLRLAPSAPLYPSWALLFVVAVAAGVAVHRLVEAPLVARLSRP